MSNKKLQEKYEDIYKEGKEKFFSRFVNGKDISETNESESLEVMNGSSALYIIERKK